MRKILLVFILLFAIVPAVFATSQQAYQDYLYQFNLYRQRYSEFQVAKNEYQKFQTLASQTQALATTKAMMSQRDLLLRSYLLYLYEKLSEDQGLGASTKQTYQTLIRNEVTFLEGHYQLIPSINTLEDAVSVSEQLESHYQVLQTSMYQIINSISLGRLVYISRFFDQNVTVAQQLVNANSLTLLPEKVSTINQWILQIGNKRSLYQQKVDEINAANTALSATDTNDLSQKYADITRLLGEAKQYLLDGTSYLSELANALKYTN